MNQVTHVSLFSGYGGLDIGLKMAIPNIRTVLYCENNRYAQGVIMSRMRDGGLDPAPIWTDVRTLDGRPWRGCVDIISGGFPCQDVSVAGKRAGIVSGNRSGLWLEFARVIGEIRPAIAFIENVAGLVSNGLEIVLCDLAAMGYDAEWGVVSAADAGANHKRERVWILASDPYQQHDNWWSKPQLSNGKERSSRPEPERVRIYESLSNSNSFGLEKQQQSFKKEQTHTRTERSRWWEVEPGLGRVADGAVFRVERLRLCGNGVVPQQAALAWEILSERIK